MRKTILVLFAILSIVVQTAWSAPTDTVGFQILPFEWTCIDTVRIRNLCVGGTSYEWDFGDTVVVTNDTLPVSHVYEYSGRYTITLVARRNGVILGMASDVVSVNGRYAGSISDSVDCRHPYVAKNGIVFRYPCDTLFYVREGACMRAYKLHLGHITTHYSMTRMLCGGERLCLCDTCISTRGEYHLGVVSPDGCDSIVDLTVYAGNARDTVRLDFCKGDRPVINYRTYTQNATFTDTFSTFCGGDSIVHYIINFHDATHQVIQRMMCPGDSIYYDGKYYNAPNNYVHRYTSVRGCDSVVTLQVLLYDHYYQTDSVVVADSVYLWEGLTISKNGRYFRHYKTAEGCDSTLEMNVFFDRPERTYLFRRICSGEVANFNGRALTQSGVYVDTLHTVDGGIDSIVTLNLQVFTTVYDTVRVKTCGTSYTFHGETYNEGGTYDIVIPFKNVSPADALDCDSIVYHLDLELCPNFRHEDSFEFSCAEQTYQWAVDSFVYTPVERTVLHHYMSACGCDSDYVLKLTLPSSYRVLKKCAGTSIILNGDTITDAGKYTFTLKSACGLDSTETVEIVDEPITETYDTATICDGERYLFRGKYYSVPGDYVDTFPQNDPCPEYHHLHLVVCDTFHVVENIELCTETTLIWHGKRINASGHYFARFKTLHGCDSIYEGFITIHRARKTNLHAQICQGDSCQLGTRWYKKTGIYYDSLLTVDGCDSITQLVLNVMPEYFFAMRDTFCQGGQYIFRGDTLTHGGIYYDSLKSAAGCDSIYMLDLVMRSPSHVIEYATECNRTIYPWRGMVITKSGTYYDTVTNPSGCDSIIELRLAMYKPAFVSTHATICDGDSLWFANGYVSRPGRFYDTLRTTHGCDSIIELCLNVQHKIITQINATICDGDEYKFNGVRLTNPGIYFDTLTTIYGCDSIVRLVLQVTPTGNVYEQHVFLCDGDSFSFRGHTFTDGAIFYDTLMTIHGCDSIMKYVFTVGTTMHDYKSASICQGDYYSFHGRRLISSGSFTHVVRDPVSNCETAVYHLELEVRPSFYFIEQDTICDDHLYIWHNQIITKSGVYTDSNAAVNGCDSIYELHIVVNHMQYIEQNVRLCAGQSVTVSGKTFTEPGIFCDSTLTSRGCDSITKFIVTVKPDYFFSDTVSVCRGAYYKFRGRNVLSPGIYRDTLATVAGCDSIYEIVVMPRPVVFNIEYDTLCSDIPYLWHGRIYTQKGVYRDTFVTAEGCMGVDELWLEYKRSYNITQGVMLCPSQTYTYNGIDRSTPGVYVDSLTTVLGCDSVVTTVVTRNYDHDFYDTVAICRSDYYSFFGQRLVNAGDYYHVVNTSSTGCDTIYHVHLVVKPDYYSLEYATECNNGYYYWRGKNLPATGAYFDTVATPNGCDSIFELRLTLYPVSDTIITESICDGDTYYMHNRPYTRQGVYYDTLQNRFGCDSIVKLVLNVRSKYTFVHDDTICQGEVYNFFGTSITNSGLYRRTVPAPNGCDSVFVLNLVVKPIAFSRIDTTICLGDVYFFHGRRITQSALIFDTIMVDGCYSVTQISIDVKAPVYHYDTLYFIKGDTAFYHNRPYTAAGQYYETVKSAEGCDSIYYVMNLIDIPYEKYLYLNICDNEPILIHNHYYDHSVVDSFLYDSHRDNVADTLFHVYVTAYPHAETVIYDTVCNNGTYRFVHNQVLTHSGIYFDTLSTSDGCDSIIILHLEVLDRDYQYDIDTICSTGTYHWVGPNRTLTMAGNYYDSVPNPLCKCYKYYELDLVVMPETRLQNANGAVNSVTICADEDSYTIWPTFTGPTPTEYIVAYDGIKIEENNNDTGYYDGISIVLPFPRDKNNGKVRPDVYPVTLYVGNGYCDATPYALTFDLHVNYDSAVIRQHFNNVVSVLNSAYNGGYIFSGYMWFVNGSMVIDATESNLYLPSLVPGDIVYAMLRRQNEKDFIPTCPITIKPYTDLQPYPTLDGTLFVPGSMAGLNSPEAGAYSIYDMKGMLISTGRFLDGENSIAMPYVSGCYLLHVVTDSYTYTFKVVVR